MKELCHIVKSLFVVISYTFVLFLLLCLSITDTTAPNVTLLLSILWCIGITVDSLILFHERERLDYE